MGFGPWFSSSAHDSIPGKSVGGRVSASPGPIPGSRHNGTVTFISSLGKLRLAKEVLESGL